MHARERLVVVIRPNRQVWGACSPHFLAVLEVNSAPEDNNALAVASMRGNLSGVFQCGQVNAGTKTALGAGVQTCGRDWRKGFASGPVVQVNATGASHGEVVRILVLADSTIVLGMTFVAPRDSAWHLSRFKL